MHPFCGYNMNQYFEHWSNFRKLLGYNIPKIFVVNWFRKDADGSFLWPGFDENSRVLKWVFERTLHKADATRTDLGWVPVSESAIDTKGIEISQAAMKKLLAVNKTELAAEVEQIEKYFQVYGSGLPQVLRDELEKLRGDVATPSTPRAN
jgi:phosphoenolpyruvate carboxykinase (GTP)